MICINYTEYYVLFLFRVVIIKCLLLLLKATSFNVKKGVNL